MDSVDYTKINARLVSEPLAKADQWLLESYTRTLTNQGLILTFGMLYASLAVLI